MGARLRDRFCVGAAAASRRQVGSERRWISPPHATPRRNEASSAETHLFVARVTSRRPALSNTMTEDGPAGPVRLLQSARLVLHRRHIRTREHFFSLKCILFSLSSSHLEPIAYTQHSKVTERTFAGGRL